MKYLVLHMVWGKGGGEVGMRLLDFWGEKELKRVFHKRKELCTKLSTGFYTTIAESFPLIHRLYYHNYFN